MDSNKGSKLGYMILGLGLGAVVGLLLVLRTGEETRKIIRDRADEGRDYLKTKAHEFSDQVDELAGKGKEWVDRGRAAAEEAFDNGKQAYRDINRKS